jgi:hypothetical protein
MKRKDGYYWVKYGGQWFIGKYNAEEDNWMMLEYFNAKKDNQFNEINETPIPPPTN